MIKTFKYRIYPTHKQEKSMLGVLNTCRHLYNHFLAERKNTWEKEKKRVSCFDQIKSISKLAPEVDPNISYVYSQTLQEVPRRLDKAFQNFFRRCKSGETPGYPRFKNQDRYRSFTYPQNNGSFKLVEDDKKIYLSKIGCVKIKYHRKLQGTPKTCVVSRSSTGKWFVAISCVEVPKTQVNQSDLEVGIDVGLKDFATFSDGNKIKNPRIFNKSQDRLARVQRKLSKLEKGTSKRRSFKKVVAKVYEKVANQREDFVHKKSKEIVDKYGVICVEDLDVKQMIEKKPIEINGKKVKLAKSISDVAWSSFLNKLSYKAENAGRTIQKVNPRNTSKTCNSCGFVNMELTLKDRVFICPSCGIELDRDLNAARNILRVGLDSLATQKVA